MYEVEKIKRLLDDYYGDHRDEDTKEDIANFIINFFGDIQAIMEGDD